MIILNKKIRIFNILNCIFLSLVALFTLIPFLMVLSGSFTDEKELINKGISLIPKVFSANGYKYIFLHGSANILSGYKITIFITLVGGLLSLLTTASLSYVISIRTLRLRNYISFFVYFTMLFNGGVIPWYILCVKYLHLNNTIWALILPMLVNPFYVMIMRTYFKGIPDSLRESAIIDGAAEMRILFSIILPVSVPIIATISLFYMLAYWNDFYNALFLIDKKSLIPLQYYLYRINSSLSFIAAADSSTGKIPGNVILPSEGVRLATTILTIGPIIFVYPFIQRFFIKGITIGAVKG
jgi:putative aldouronate transport system permease protein